MKKLTTIQIDNRPHEAVITYYMAAKMKDRIIEWVDEKNHIAKHRGDAFFLTVYMKDKDDERNVRAMEISAASIKNLYNEILEIEKIESEDFVD